MNQLALFEEPARRLGGGPPSVQAAHARAFSDLVLGEIEARLNERPGEWLEWRDFDDIRDRHDIGCCIGHAKYYLSHIGRAIRKNIYSGSEQLGPDYRGFYTVYGSTLCGPAPEKKTRKK